MPRHRPRERWRRLALLWRTRTAPSSPTKSSKPSDEGRRPPYHVPLPSTSGRSVTSNVRTLTGVTDRDDFAQENLWPPPDESPARPEETPPQPGGEPAPDKHPTD